MLRCKTETRPGLVALYDIRPGNTAGPFLQPRNPHGAIVTRLMWFQSSLEWTQASVALGDFVALCSIRIWVSWFGVAGHSNQDGCAYVLSSW